MTSHFFFALAKRYIVIDKISKTWYNARRDCLGRNLDLATINDKPEMATIRALLSGGVSYWIGLTSLKGNGTFKWVTTGSVNPAFRDWAKDEPNNHGGTERCVELEESKYQMNDVPCNNKRGFICEAQGNVLNLRFESVVGTFSYFITLICILYGM